MHRPKWCCENVEIKDGDLILKKISGNSGFLKWNLAPAINVHPGKDDVQRIVTLRLKMAQNYNNKNCGSAL